MTYNFYKVLTVLNYRKLQEVKNMKKKVSKLICMTLILCMLMSINVFAQEGNLGNSETIAVEQSEFEKVIEEILQIQKSNPMMTEEEILVTMDAKFDNAKEARGISEIWNVLTDAEKKLCMRNVQRQLDIQQQERSLQIRDLLIGGLRKQKRQSEHRKRIWNHIAKC